MHQESTHALSIFNCSSLNSTYSHASSFSLWNSLSYCFYASLFVTTEFIFSLSLLKFLITHELFFSYGIVSNQVHSTSSCSLCNTGICPPLYSLLLHSMVLDSLFLALEDNLAWETYLFSFLISDCLLYTWDLLILLKPSHVKFITTLPSIGCYYSIKTSPKWCWRSHIALQCS